MKDFIAKIISRPLTIALILLAVLSVLIEAQIGLKYEALLAIFTFVVPISTIVLFKVFKITSDFNVTQRSERPKLFIIMGMAFLYSLHIAYLSQDAVLIAIYQVLNLTFFTGFLITLFWKISYHMIWSCIAIFTIIYLWQIPYFYLLLVLLPLIAWSRLELKRHNIMQVLAGTGLTGICIYIVLTYF
jgi:membrane-associated phospholipid phosphatase